MNAEHKVSRDGVPILTFDNVTSGWEQWVLLTSDRHWDNPKSDRKLQRKHLDLAVERDALILDTGDWFCLMQGKYDPRGTKSDVRPEHNVGNYLDAVVDTAVEWFAPYADRIVMIARGNHDASVLKRQETDVMRRFVTNLNREAGTNVQLGGIRGWVQFKYRRGARTSLPGTNLYYHHGYGGGGPVTRGVIQTNRMAAYVTNADVVLGGHIHEGWIVPIQRIALNTHGRESLVTQWHVNIPTYKEEFHGSGGGFHHERGRPPKPTGCVWLRLYQENEQVRYDFTLDV